MNKSNGHDLGVVREHRRRLWSVTAWKWATITQTQRTWEASPLPQHKILHPIPSQEARDLTCASGRVGACLCNVHPPNIIHCRSKQPDPATPLSPSFQNAWLTLAWVTPLPLFQTLNSPSIISFTPKNSNPISLYFLVSIFSCGLWLSRWTLRGGRFRDLIRRCTTSVSIPIMLLTPSSPMEDSRNPPIFLMYTLPIVSLFPPIPTKLISADFPFSL